MSDAQQVRRAVERFQRGRRWEHSAFPTSSGGLLHTPYPRLGAGQPRTAGGGGDITIGQAAIGEILRADVEGHLSPGGEPVVWSNVVSRLGFASATFPNVELRLPHSAVYGIEGDMSWTDGFLGGGRVSLLLNGVGIPGLSPIRAGGAADSTVGRTFTLAQEFVAREGDRLMVVMDHAGDAHHDLEGVIEVATKEPLRVRVTPPGPGPVQAIEESTTGSSGGSGATVDKPDDVQEGDLLIACVGAYSETTAVTGPFGWDHVGANDGGAGSVIGTSVWFAWKIAGSSEPSSYAFSVNGAGRGINVRLARVRGVKTPTKWRFGADLSGGAMSVLLASLTADPGSLLLHSMVWRASDGSVTMDGGAFPNGTWGNGRIRQEPGVSGATGDRTCSTTGGNRMSYGMILLEPA